MSIGVDGTAKFLSYINNLHPVKHKALYGTIEKIFSRFVPLFNRVLSDVANKRVVRVDPFLRYDEVSTASLLACNYVCVYDFAVWCCQFDCSPYDPDIDQKWEDYQAKRQSQPVKLYQYTTGCMAPKTLVDIRGRTVQVIVKAAEIILTPDRPEYQGGSWHIEGMRNEGKKNA